MIEQSPRPWSGRILVVEGADGAGKGVVISALSGELAARRVPHIVLTALGATKVGHTVRALVKDASLEISPEVHQYLTFAAVTSVMEQSLSIAAAGSWVILDRSALSTLAYLPERLRGSEVAEEFALTNYHELVDDTIIVKASAETRRARIMSRPNPPDKLDRLSEGYEVQDRLVELARRFSHREIGLTEFTNDSSLVAVHEFAKSWVGRLVDDHPTT